jgi:hypothetical protein
VNTYILCNGTDGKTTASGFTHYTPYSTAPVPCDQGKHTSFFYGDVAYGDKDVAPQSAVGDPEKDFTVTVADAAASRIKIEWLQRSGAGSLRYDLPTGDGEWASGAGSMLRGSRTCNGSSCKLCVQGGTCDYPGLPQEAISPMVDGNPSIFYVRAILSDSYGNSITTGWDPYPGSKASGIPILDKYVKYIVCGPKCAGCSNKEPQVAGAADSCDAKNQHKIDWSISGGENQTAYTLQIQEISTDEGGNANPLHEHSGGGEKTFTVVPGSLTNGNLDPSKSYRWRIRVKDADKQEKCKMWSAWTAWQNLKACTTPPPENKCPANGKPVARLSGAFDSDGNVCNGFLYTLDWDFIDAGDTQSAYQVQIREIGGGSDIYDSGVVASGTTSILLDSLKLSSFRNPKGQALKIVYGKTYEWRVQVTDQGPAGRPDCRLVSDWTNWSGADAIAGNDIRPPKNQPPVVQVTVTNGKVNCETGGCRALQDLQFRSDGSTYSAAPVSYQWYLDGKPVADKDGGRKDNFAYKYLISDAKNHVAQLQITDGSGLTCADEGVFNFGKPSPVWTEIVPR